MKTVLLVLFTLLFNLQQKDNIPDKVYSIAKKGNKVCLQSHDDNAVVHAKNAIESWGYWKVVKKEEDADFILKLFLHFEGAGVCIVNATFVDPATKNVLYSTREVTSVKKAKGFDFNTKRSAIRQLVELVLKPNFD